MLAALLDRTFRRRQKDEHSEEAMAGRLKSGSGSDSGRAAGPRQQKQRGAGAPAAAAAAAAPGPTLSDPKVPRGMRETAALLRANGYGVLSEEKLRNHHASAPVAAREQPARPPAQPQRQQRQVRLVEPPQAAAPADRRRPADKRKQAESSASEDERPARARGAAPAAQQQQQQQQPQALKRVRSSWKMRPLLVDEKLTVFLEGQDDALLHYDGGEFYQWLLDCESGAADPADALPYPLVVQDRDLRTLLEIKPPGEGGLPGGELAAVPAAAAGGEGIIVPTVRQLAEAEQPDNLVREQEPPVVQRMQDAEQPDVVGKSAAAQAASAAWLSAERAVALDPPYIRYVQPTPDDLDLAVEYDLDEDDEEWLEQFNTEAKRAKSRKGRRTLGEEWMEHLIDRMEKEYTAELQKHPGKWVVQAADPGATEPPAISIPSIEEVFPLEKCLQVPGINHYDNIIEAVYHYWQAKHERAGRPLIQRLWYEPPWDRRKAAQRLASSAADGDGGGSDDGPFHAQDSPVALAGIRKRRMDPEDVKARFQEMRRDLESARTLADQVRKREKLKRRELQLYKEEWAARMQAIRDGVERVVLRQGRVKDPPVQLSAVWRMEAFGPAASAGSEYSDELSDEHLAMGAPQDAAAQAEDRAARLAMRRYARDAALGLPPPRSQQKQQQPARPRSGVATQRKAQQLQPGPARAAAASPILNQGGNVRGPPAGRGVKREPVCVWCHSDEFHLLGCASCHRCFCFKCFQRRPGLGIKNWSRAVKDARYRCVICRGLEAEDAPSANTADKVAATDAEDATSPQQVQPRPRPQQLAALPSNRAEAEAMGLDLPPGLGGAALRSFLLKRQREDDDQGGGSCSDQEEPAEEEPQPQQSSRHRAAHKPAAAQARRLQQRAAGSSDEEPHERPKQRKKLGGAALAAHLKRLAQQQQQQQQPASSDSEDEEEQASRQQRQLQPQPPALPSNRAEAEAWGIELPPGLGGAALRSFLLKRQELLDGPAAAQSDSEQPASSDHDAAAAAGPKDWPHSHIPPPPRRLGGAALASYIKRQEQLLEEEGGEPSGSSSGTALGAGGEESDDATSGPAASSGDEEQSQHKENRAPPVKRHRKSSGGAAVPAHLRKQPASAPAAAASKRGAAGGRRAGC